MRHSGQIRLDPESHHDAGFVAFRGWDCLALSRPNGCGVVKACRKSAELSRGGRHFVSVVERQQL